MGVEEVFERYSEVVPGAVALVGRRVVAVGTTAFGGVEPMRRDTLFRIASMTKPITAAAAVLLAEEGALDLDEPVDRLLPELAGRGITARHLLTLRLGFGLAFEPSPEWDRAVALGLALGPPKPASPHGPDEWLRRFASVPPMRPPGERWMYDAGFAVLGVLVARAGGRPLGAVLRERVFEPLGMVDTGFSVPPEELHRLPPCYADDGSVFDDPADSQWSREPAFPDAAGGLVSTVDDYARFARALVGGGLLSAASLRAMTTDHLTPELRAASPHVPIFLGEAGWGFGLAVERDRFGWSGGLGTSFSCYPATGDVEIVLTQRTPPPTDLFDAFHGR
ncbi:serine hydrolase domain-containing protein [Saccharothrix xinjiangensis]|uniref:Serine hydrolase domain-containing protein n=1 Tax=Saccharothrix xinjiangensis TaxID=204798 RepID=A0ABV9XUY1_9PSEU